MALLDLVTLPVRPTVAAAETTLALGELVAAEGPILRRNGYADRLMLVTGEGGLATLNRAVEPLSELANRVPGGRRRSAVEA